MTCQLMPGEIEKSGGTTKVDDALPASHGVLLVGLPGQRDPHKLLDRVGSVAKVFRVIERLKPSGNPLNLGRHVLSLRWRDP